MSIYTKLAKVQGLAVEKDAENPFFHCKYVSLDNLITTLAPILKENDWLIYHFTENKEVVTVLHDTEKDEYIKSAFPLPDVTDPQKLGSAITYAKRYNLGQIFNIITDEDNDGNGAKQPDNATTTSKSVPSTPTTPTQSNVADKGWMEEQDFERLKGELKSGDTYPQVKGLRDSGWKISKATAQLITDYINQL